MKQDIAIVYMVAGISSRFGGRIKQFANIGPNGESLIEYSLNQALKAGFTKIVFIVGNMTEKPFKEKFNNEYNGVPVYYALQTYNPETRDRPWGTSDALCTIKGIVKTPFVICNGDDIYGESAFKTLISHLKNNKEEATLGYKLVNVIPEKGKTHRGIFQEKDNYVTSLKETFSIDKQNLSATNCKPGDLCSMNIFALHPKTIELMDEKLVEFKDKNKDDRKAEALLPTMLSELVEEKKIKMKLYPFNEKWFGVTNPEDEEIVRKQLIEYESLKH